MTKNLRKLEFAMLCCLLMLESGVVVGQTQAESKPTPFDSYGRITWPEEVDHLDRFAEELIKQKTMVIEPYLNMWPQCGQTLSVNNKLSTPL